MLVSLWRNSCTPICLPLWKRPYSGVTPEVLRYPRPASQFQRLYTCYTFFRGMFFPWVTAWLNLISLPSLFKRSLSRKAFPGHTLCDRPPGLLLLPLHRITVLGRTRAFYSYLFTCRLSDYSVSSTRVGTLLPSAVILMLRTSQAHPTPPGKKKSSSRQ